MTGNAVITTRLSSMTMKRAIEVIRSVQRAPRSITSSPPASRTTSARDDPCTAASAGQWKRHRFGGDSPEAECPLADRVRVDLLLLARHHGGKHASEQDPVAQPAHNRVLPVEHLPHSP